MSQTVTAKTEVKGKRLLLQLVAHHLYCTYQWHRKLGKQSTELNGCYQLHPSSDASDKHFLVCGSS